jgi:transposase
MSKKRRYKRIPEVLSEKEFNAFVCEHLIRGVRGPDKKLSYFKLFNYILKFMYLGCQWHSLPIDKDADGKPEVHYTTIFRAFKYWTKAGCFEKLFVGSVAELFKAKLLDISVIHGDGTTTSAKKGAIIWDIAAINTQKEIRL